MSEQAPEPSVNAVVALQADINSRIVVANVRKCVVDPLVDKEAARRANLLTSALVKRDELAIAAAKIKPDVVQFSPVGEKTESFSAKKYDELQKANAAVAKLDQAIEKALNSADYQQVEKIVADPNAA